MRPLLTIVLSLCCASAFADETVRTTDGRTILLRDDGTYSASEDRAKVSVAIVEAGENFFTHSESDYGQKRVNFMPRYKNVGDKEITGVKFTARFLNAFGEEIFKVSGDSDEKVAPGKTSSTSLFYYFEDNPFIPSEPYDKLLPMVMNQSGTIDVAFDAVALSNGEIVKP